MPRDKNNPGHCFILREKNADTFENTRRDSQMLPTADINLPSLSVYTNITIIILYIRTDLLLVLAIVS